MGKSKKITEKVKQFYRGPANKPNRVATQDDMLTIEESLRECFPQRGRVFVTNWRGERCNLKLVVGLSASLRALKQKRIKAIIYDETAADHLAKYLNEFARIQRLPILQACGLVEKAPIFKLSSMLIVSIVTSIEVASDIIISSGFDRLCKLLCSIETPNNIIEFKEPVLERIPSTGKSKEKKQNKKAAATKQTHVVKFKRVKMSKKVRHQKRRK